MTSLGHTLSLELAESPHSSAHPDPDPASGCGGRESVGPSKGRRMLPEMVVEMFLRAARSRGRSRQQKC